MLYEKKLLTFFSNAALSIAFKPYGYQYALFPY
jgi:hypothetical protein